MNVPGLEKAGAVILVVLTSQAIARWRVGLRERAQSRLPLFDPVLLETALAPRPPDDPSILEALRAIFRQHRRVQDAEALNAAIAAYYQSLGDSQRETVRRVIARLQEFSSVMPVLPVGLE